MEVDDAFVRATLYSSFRRSKILRNIDVKDLDTQTLRGLINKANGISMRELPILLAKLATKFVLQFARDKIPAIRRYVTPDNIEVKIEEDELVYLLSTPSALSSNIYLIVFKNIVSSVIGSSIVELKEALSRNKVPDDNDDDEYSWGRRKEPYDPNGNKNDVVYPKIPVRSVHKEAKLFHHPKDFGALFPSDGSNSGGDGSSRNSVVGDSSLSPPPPLSLPNDIAAHTAATTTSVSTSTTAITAAVDERKLINDGREEKEAKDSRSKDASHESAKLLSSSASSLSMSKKILDESRNMTNMNSDTALFGGKLTTMTNLEKKTTMATGTTAVENTTVKFNIVENERVNDDNSVSDDGNITSGVKRSRDNNEDRHEVAKKLKLDRSDNYYNVGSGGNDNNSVNNDKSFINSVRGHVENNVTKNNATSDGYVSGDYDYMNRGKKNNVVEKQDGDYIENLIVASFTNNRKSNDDDDNVGNNVAKDNVVSDADVAAVAGVDAAGKDNKIREKPSVKILENITLKDAQKFKNINAKEFLDIVGRKDESKSLTQERGQPMFTMNTAATATATAMMGTATVTATELAMEEGESVLPTPPLSLSSSTLSLSSSPVQQQQQQQQQKPRVAIEESEQQKRQNDEKLSRKITATKVAKRRNNYRDDYGDEDGDEDDSDNKWSAQRKTQSRLPKQQRRQQQQQQRKTAKKDIHNGKSSMKSVETTAAKIINGNGNGDRRRNGELSLHSGDENSLYDSDENGNDNDDDYLLYTEKNRDSMNGYYVGADRYYGNDGVVYGNDDDDDEEEEDDGDNDDMIVRSFRKSPSKLPPSLVANKVVANDNTATARQFTVAIGRGNDAAVAANSVLNDDNNFDDGDDDVFM